MNSATQLTLAILDASNSAETGFRWNYQAD